MSEAERDEAVAAIRQEMPAIEQGAQQEREQRQKAAVARTFGAPVQSDPEAEAEAAKLEAELDKMLKGAEATHPRLLRQGSSGSARLLRGCRPSWPTRPAGLHDQPGRAEACRGC